jgi:hypothetical protein
MIYFIVCVQYYAMSIRQQLMATHFRYSRIANTILPMLKPQDIVVVLKIVALDGQLWSYNQLALELGMSTSESHAAVKRAIAAGLLNDGGQSVQPNRNAIAELLEHGVRYVFFAQRGELTRGIPTAHAAPPLFKHILQNNEPPPVWPDAEGTVRGYALAPLYKSVPYAAMRDPKLYALLALVDAVRDGRARERNLAIKEIRKRLEVESKGRSHAQ